MTDAGPTHAWWTPSKPCCPPLPLFRPLAFRAICRPGPRLVDALEFLVGLLHARPAAIPADFPWQWWRAPPAGWPAAEAAAAAEA